MVIVDGIGYDIDVLHLKRTADFLDKYAERTESGDLKRELIGVYFNYKLELGPGIKPDEYARFWRKLTEPVEFHTVTVPDEAGDYTFKAYFSNVGDELLRKKGGQELLEGSDRELYREGTRKNVRRRTDAHQHTRGIWPVRRDGPR